MEKATGAVAGKVRNESGLPTPPVSHAFSHAMGIAIQALQLLMALPFLSLQMWQNAMSGAGRLER
jgi:hypothetical protein